MGLGIPTWEQLLRIPLEEGTGEQRKGVSKGTGANN